MGYKRSRKVYKLTFPEYDGLEVTARSLSLGQLMKMQRALATFGEDTSEAEVMDTLLSWFCKAFISWNLEDEDGNPVPPTREALEEEDVDFVLEVVYAWRDAIAGVPDDLGKDSSSGETSLAESIPMAPL